MNVREGGRGSDREEAPGLQERTRVLQSGKGIFEVERIDKHASPDMLRVAQFTPLYPQDLVETPHNMARSHGAVLRAFLQQRLSVISVTKMRIKALPYIYWPNLHLPYAATTSSAIVTES